MNMLLIYIINIIFLVVSFFGTLLSTANYLTVTYGGVITSPDTKSKFGKTAIIYSLILLITSIVSFTLKKEIFL